MPSEMQRGTRKGRGGRPGCTGDGRMAGGRRGSTRPSTMTAWCTSREYSGQGPTRRVTSPARRLPGDSYARPLTPRRCIIRPCTAAARADRSALSRSVHNARAQARRTVRRYLLAGLLRHVVHDPRGRGGQPRANVEDVMKEIDRVVRDERGQTWKVGFLAWRPSGGANYPDLRGRMRLGCTPASGNVVRSEEHTSELQSPCNLVCRLLLDQKKRTYTKG